MFALSVHLTYTLVENSYGLNVTDITNSIKNEEAIILSYSTLNALVPPLIREDSINTAVCSSYLTVKLLMTSFRINF